MTKELHRRLEAIIARTPPGAKLPSEPKLAQQLGVSRATLREAMRVFEIQGLIHRRQGAGTFVLSPSLVLESGLEILESIETQARRMGLPVSMGSLQVERRSPSAAERDALELSADVPVVDVRRVILLEERPVAYLVDVFPESVLHPGDLERGFTGSVLDLFLRRGDPPLGTSRCDILAAAAPSHVARPLGIQRGDVLMVFKSLLLTREGKPIDVSQSYFLPGYFRFHVVRRVA